VTDCLSLISYGERHTHHDFMRSILLIICHNMTQQHRPTADINQRCSYNINVTGRHGLY